MTEKWVFNASPLILLGKAKQLDWLAGLGTVIIPSAVADEIRVGRPDDPAREFSHLSRAGAQRRQSRTGRQMKGLHQRIAR